MRKILLISMLVVLASLSFAKKEDNDSFYGLYQEAYKAVETPEMHKQINLEKKNVGVVKDIINNGWYELKELEADKLKEVFAIDRLLIDGLKNQKKIDKHFEEIKKINEKMKDVYNNAENELKKYVDLDKM